MKATTPGKNLDKFYEEELKDLLIPLEKERRKLAIPGRWGFLLLFLTFIFCLIYFFHHSDKTRLVLFVSLGASIILLIIYARKKKKYVTGFKEIIIRRIIHFIDPSFQYKPDYAINENDYTSSGLFLEKPDRYKGDDYIEGKKDKTFFCFSELHTQKRVSTGKNSHWVTIFKGLFFIGDFNKNFQGRTYVYNEKNPQVGFFTKLFSSFTSGLEKIKLESIEFEKRFIVYGSDQVEARYILTPSLMERMANLDEMMGPGISFSFVKSNLYVAIPVAHGLFEPSVFSKNSFAGLTEYYNTVQIVFDIIDELKLNERLWTKD